MISRPASFRADEVAAAVSGAIDRGVRTDLSFAGVSTDTRDDLSNQLFVALVGERFNAHDFLKLAVEGGAAGLLVARREFLRVGGRTVCGSDVHVIAVDDTLVALGELARFHRMRSQVPVIGLTGSNGKTTTKEMLASILSVNQEVLATAGNLNNLIGLPLTLLGIQPGHEVCVAEMGMNALGEIARMTEIAEPDIGLVTNVGRAHIGELGSQEAIAQAKGELFLGLHSEDAVAVVNADDPWITDWFQRARVNRAITFGSKPEADVRLLEAQPEGAGQRLALSVRGQNLSLKLPLPGHHNGINAAAACAAALALRGEDLSKEELRTGLESLNTVKGRLAVKETAGVTIIDDSYNANGASALAAIETAASIAAGRRLVVAFGEMLELGAFSHEEHSRVGRALAEAGVSVIAAFGPEAAPVASHSTASVRHEAEDFDSLNDWLMGQLRKGDVVLVKGSRGSRMERVIARIEEGI